MVEEDAMKVMPFRVYHIGLQHCMCISKKAASGCDLECYQMPWKRWISLWECEN